MAWKYLNPGDYRLLDNYVSASVRSYADNVIAPVTHMAFQNESAGNTPIVIPSGTKDIWIAATITSESNTDSDYYAASISLYTPSNSRYKSCSASFSRSLTCVTVNAATRYRQVVNLNARIRIVRVLLHVKSGLSDGAVDLYLDGKLAYAESNINVAGGEDIFVYSLYFNSSYLHYCSDLIISDAPIDLAEHVAVLPIANTNAEGWTYDAVNNIYTADSANKSIWQVPDINQLKAVTGLDNPSVTAVAIQAYNVSTNDTSQVDTLQKAVKQNGQVVITDSADISTATAVISPAMTINPVTNAAWTLNDLANLQLGITTAKSA